MSREILALRVENKRLRQENKWHRAEAEKWQARTKELETVLQEHKVTQKRSKPKKAGNRLHSQSKPKQPSAVTAGNDTDWYVWHLLGAGEKKLAAKAEEGEIFWDNLQID